MRRSASSCSLASSRAAAAAHQPVDEAAAAGRARAWSTGRRPAPAGSPTIRAARNRALADVVGRRRAVQGDRLGSPAVRCARDRPCSCSLLSGQASSFAEGALSGACGCSGHAKTCSAERMAPTAVSFSWLRITGGCQGPRMDRDHVQTHRPFTCRWVRKRRRTMAPIFLYRSVQRQIRRRQANFYTDR